MLRRAQPHRPAVRATFAQRGQACPQRAGLEVPPRGVVPGEDPVTRGARLGDPSLDVLQQREALVRVRGHLHERRDGERAVRGQLEGGLVGSLREIEPTRKLLDPSLGEGRSEEHTSELQSRENLVCRLLLEKKKKEYDNIIN